MKHCSSCKQTLDYSLFGKNTRSKDGYAFYCVACKAISNAKHRLKHKDTIAQKKQDEYFKNQEENKAKRVADYLNNKEAYKARAKAWKQNNKARHNALCMMRHTKKLHATPTWLTKEDIDKIGCFYSVAQMLSKHGNEPYEVDHIIPLQGKDVCGLHVPWNLQVITQEQNCRKRNKYKQP